MLRVASFKITDADGINELLSKYRLAGGAHILVSEGSLCIPYEDGAPINDAQRTVAIREQQNTIIQERDIIEHSQKVLETLMADAQERVNVAQANVDATKDKGKKHVKADERDELERKLKEAKAAQSELVNQHRMNAHEIVRLNLNLDLFDQQVATLKA